MACGEHEHCDECGCVPPLMADIAKRQAEYILGMAPDRIEAGEAATEWDDDEWDEEMVTACEFTGSQNQVISDVYSILSERDGLTCPSNRGFEQWTTELVVRALTEWAEWQRSKLLRKGA